MSLSITITPISSTEAAITAVSGVTPITYIPSSKDGYTIREIRDGAISDPVEILVLPPSLTTLEEDSLTGVTGIVYFYGSVPTVTGDPFGATEGLKVYAYLGAYGWPAVGELWYNSVVGRMGTASNSLETPTPTVDYGSSDDFILYTGGALFSGTQEQVLVASISE